MNVHYQRLWIRGLGVQCTIKVIVLPLFAWEFFVAQIWTVWHSQKRRLSTSTRLLYIMGFVFTLHRSFTCLSRIVCQNELMCIAIEPKKKYRNEIAVLLNGQARKIYLLILRPPEERKLIYSIPLPSQQNSRSLSCMWFSWVKMETFAFPRIIFMKRLKTIWRFIHQHV